MAKFKRLLNMEENQALRLIERSALSNNAKLFSKVRIADVLPIEKSGISNDLYTYALKAHFDFVITDFEFYPLFVIEYDGTGHFIGEKCISNDKMKNELCENFQMPISRVTNEHVLRKARNLDYLTWLTELFFTVEALRKAQENGSFPQDEPIDPFWAYSIPNHKNAFPLFISSTVRKRLNELYLQKILFQSVPSYFTGDDSMGNTGCLSIIRVDECKYLYTQESIYTRGFGVAPSEVLDEISTLSLGQKIESCLEDNTPSVSPKEIRNVLVTFVKKYPKLGSFGGTMGQIFPFSFSCKVGDGTGWTIGTYEGESEVSV